MLGLGGGAATVFCELVFSSLATSFPNLSNIAGTSRSQIPADMGKSASASDD